MAKIYINIAYVVNNKGSKYYSKYVIPIFERQDGAFECRFTGLEAGKPTVTFEKQDLITVKEWKNAKNQAAAKAERKVD